MSDDGGTSELEDGELAEPHVPQGPWTDRVAFSADGGFAYRPTELLVPLAAAGEALDRLDPEVRAVQTNTPQRDVEDDGLVFARITSVDIPLNAVADLRADGIPAEPNHVLFAHCTCGCGPHPALSSAGISYAPYPFSPNPFSPNPFSPNPISAYPFSPNPISAYPFSPNPEWAEFQRSGRRSHSARPATGCGLVNSSEYDGPRDTPVVVVIDTGVAEDNLRPDALPDTVKAMWYQHPTQTILQKVPYEQPDANKDQHIDPVAGHGTFIAGLINLIAPWCDLHVMGPMSGHGDLSEHDIVRVLESLDGIRPDIVNLSFGGYAPTEMADLAQAVRRLQEKGTMIVASAGNDATCRPTYPAALPGVVSVGALGPWGPAPFTNFGPWVRACAPGVDVVSTFFKKWESTVDPNERYAEWVRWSGTSFAAPAVVGALARAMREGLSAKQAVERVIDDPALFRIPGLGTVVNQTPWWVRHPESLPQTT